jgi:DNA-binding transcriptional ArsR family regulator
MSDGDWIETTTGWAPAEAFHLDRLDLLDEFAHPVRGAIVRRLHEPLTVAELAEAMHVPVTRLYHHVNRLERDGLIRVRSTRRVAAVTERRYQAVARSFRIDESLIRTADPAALGRAVGGLFDVARSALQREFELGRFTAGDLRERGMHALLSLQLTPARRSELLERLRMIVEEFSDDDEGEPFQMLISAFPETP